MKICKECCKEFEPKNNKAIFCSKLCKQKDYRKSIASKLNLFDKMTADAKKNDIGKIALEVTKEIEGSCTNQKLEYDFGDAKFLIVEDFTKYKKEDTPKDRIQKIIWDNKKRISDHEIKIHWNNHLESKLK